MNGSVSIEYSEEVQAAYFGGENPEGWLLDRKMRQVAAALTKWVDQARAVTNRSSLFDRGAYAAPDNIFDQMRTAKKALSDDDIVAGGAEVTEGMALQGLKWEAQNYDEADLFNQMAAEQNLDDLLRKMWRESYAISQVCLGFWWDWGEFTVRGETGKGNRRKKSYRVFYPRAITTLDSAKVVPVGMLTFGQERLAWQATAGEIHQYTAVLSGDLTDELMSRFYAGQYVPRDEDEIQELTGLGVDHTKLVLLAEDLVRRFTLTKPDHQRFADVRLRSVFKMLDLKQQLMEADRVNLIGASNYILLVKKGSKEDPAYPEEITNLRENFEIVAKLPVIFSDHRLEIEIITPARDFTLDTDKYDTLDNRIGARVLGTFSALGSRAGQRSDTALSVGRIVARGLENRRHMIKRFLEREMARAVYKHPNNKNLFEGEPPSLTFVPNHVPLDEDAGVAQAIISLRTMNELSRESALEYFGFDQAVEAMRREFEDEQGLDDKFAKGGVANVPFSSTSGAAPAKQGGAGARGGRPDGGGNPPKNPQKTARTAKGTTKPSKGASR